MKKSWQYLVVVFFQSLFFTEGCVSLKADPFKLNRKRRHLIKEGVEVLRLYDAARYFSIVGHWLIWKNGSYPHAAQHAQILATRSCALLEVWRRECISEDVMRITTSSVSAHNLATIAMTKNSFMCIGGLLLKSSPEVKYFQVDQQVIQLKDQPILNLNASGCIEKRIDRTHCELDGRLSLVRLNKKNLLLYARANTNPKGGGRFVQVTRISIHSHKLKFIQDAKWSKFQAIRFVSSSSTNNIYSRILSQPQIAADRADIYFAAVNTNPVDPSSLLALLPTVIRTSHFGPKVKWQGEAAILLSLSLDGFTFSPPLPLLPAIPFGAEINDHPVDGFLTDAHSLYFFVHHGVPGTAAKLCDYKHDYISLSSKLPSSRLVRYAIPLDLLKNWTRQAKSELLIEA